MIYKGQKVETIKEYGNVQLSFEYIQKIWGGQFTRSAKPRMLDIGTNLGTLPYLIFKNSYETFECFGCDINENAIDAAKSTYPQIAYKLSWYSDKIPFCDNYFDVITMFDVIEHIRDPELFLREQVYRLLKPGGIFIFQTPNKHINSIFETLEWRSFSEWKTEHCSLQTKKTLKDILIRSGFCDVTIEKYTLKSEFNKNKLKKYFKFFAIPILEIFEVMPTVIAPNLWGHCIKSKELLYDQNFNSSANL